MKGISTCQKYLGHKIGTVSAIATGITRRWWEHPIKSRISRFMRPLVSIGDSRCAVIVISINWCCSWSEGNSWGICNGRRGSRGLVEECHIREVTLCCWAGNIMVVGKEQVKLLPGVILSNGDFIVFPVRGRGGVVVEVGEPIGLRAVQLEGRVDVGFQIGIQPDAVNLALRCVFEVKGKDGAAPADRLGSAWVSNTFDHYCLRFRHE